MTFNPDITMGTIINGIILFFTIIGAAWKSSLTQEKSRSQVNLDIQIMKALVEENNRKIQAELQVLKQDTISRLDHLVGEFDQIIFQIGRLWEWYEIEHGITHKQREAKSNTMSDTYKGKENKS